MRFLARWMVICVGLVFQDIASGLTIGVDNEFEEPPQFIYDAASATESSITIQLHNESNNLENLILWQIGLSIVSDSNSVGSVEIESFDAPMVPFLNSLGPSVRPPTMLPGTEVILTDLDMSVPPAMLGKNILTGATHDLVTISLANSPDARGSFYLALAGFDTVTGSAWSGLVPPPRSFANMAGTVLPDTIVLAELVFIVPEPDAIMLFSCSCICYLTYSTCVRTSYFDQTVSYGKMDK